MAQILFFLIQNERHRKVRSVQDRYFPLFLRITLLSFIADIVSSLDRYADWLFGFVAAGNYFELIFNTILIPVYFLYVCTLITDVNTAVKRRLNIVLWALAGLCIAVVISTAFTGQIFYFDENRVYHRGNLFWLPMSILFSMMLIIEWFMVAQRRHIDENHFRALILFLALPLLGCALQFFIFGLPFSLICVTLAIQIVFTNVQNRSMDTDYLTGVYNRRSLDNFVQNKIDTSTSWLSFSAILLDIDNFKSINDTYGHAEGDRALASAVSVLRESVGRNDFIARYGGDEFCVVFSNDNPYILEATKFRINTNLIKFNNATRKNYRLSFSMGCAVYEPSIGRTPEPFFETIDRNMYEEKKGRRSPDSILPRQAMRGNFEPS